MYVSSQSSREEDLFGSSDDSDGDGSEDDEYNEEGSDDSDRNGYEDDEYHDVDSYENYDEYGNDTDDENEDGESEDEENAFDQEESYENYDDDLDNYNDEDEDNADEDDDWYERDSDEGGSEDSFDEKNYLMMGTIDNNSKDTDEIKKEEATEEKGPAVVTPTLPPAKPQEESLPPGFGRIKSILFKKDDVLGRGCNGTIVYRGKFDQRDVAVKRLLREFFNLADREVKLLRESDQHPNVIRYYCMEEDDDFLFIALELCDGSLQDYVEDKLQNIKNIEPIELLRQALSGLAHLHSVFIVHRDLKPHNILISKPNAQGEVQAMISDFGLSTKLPPGRMSFSSKSDVFGTVGWTAPEMLEKGEKKTCAVDIFSAGCLMYYVLTKGKHPFGNEIGSIPHNIMKGQFNLDSLPMTSDGYIAKDIIQKMLSPEPGTRPTAKAVLNHPLFWCKEKKLAFIQESSDWIEVKKVSNLEQDGAQIINGDWRNHLAQEVQDNLLKDYKKRRRHYDGTTVRDLLRVIRNKKHHYNEMPEDVKKSLGSLPDQFLDHFTDRFPRLLIHTYRVMECCAKEDAFKTYYITE